MTTKLWTRNFTLITIINLLLFCGFQMFPSALPPYAKSLGAPEHLLGWITGVVSLCALIMRPVAGFALDRFGRRGIFIWGMLFMMLSTAAYAFFPFFGAILAIRFVHGLGWGIASTASNTVASDNINPERFGEGMGFFSLSSSIALAVSPAIALSLPIQPVIWTAFAITLIAFILMFLLRYENGAQPQRLEKKESPFEKASLRATIIIMLTSATHGAIVTFIAIYAAERGIANIGSFFTVYAGAMLLTRPLIGRLIDRKGYGAGVYPGVICTVGGLIILALAQTLPYFYLCAAIYGIGYGAIHTSTQTMAVAPVAAARRGAANATYFTGFDVGIGIGSVIAGLVARRFGYSLMFGLSALLPIFSLLLYLFTQKSALKQQEV